MKVSIDSYLARQAFFDALKIFLDVIEELLFFHVDEEFGDVADFSCSEVQEGFAPERTMLWIEYVLVAVRYVLQVFLV